MCWLVLQVLNVSMCQVSTMACGDVSTAWPVRSATNTRNFSELLTTCRRAGWPLRVPATKDDKAVAARILREHGVVHMVYMGKATYETLGP